jgi:transposase, IS5 family
MRPVRGYGRAWPAHDFLMLLKHWEAAMARRRTGQETFGFEVARARGGSSLERLHGLIAWLGIERQLDGIYGAAKGEPAWPPVALFKALLLAVWYDLSDVKLAEALDDRASFRRFCGFSTHEGTPERAAFVRFRKELLTQGLDKTLFDEVTRQSSRPRP